MEYLDMAITGLIAFIVGGGLVQLLKAGRERDLVAAQAKSLGAKTEAEVHDLSLASVIKLNEHLQRQYDAQCKELDAVKAERDNYYEQLEAMRVEASELRSQLESAQEDLEQAREAVVDLQRRLSNLMDSIPNPDPPSQQA